MRSVMVACKGWSPSALGVRVKRPALPVTRVAMGVAESLHTIFAVTSPSWASFAVAVTVTGDPSVTV